MFDITQIPTFGTQQPTSGGSTTSVIGAVTEGLKAVSNLLPPGGLRDFLSNPIGTVTKFISNLGGRTFQTGQYRLGERFMRHILQKDPGSYRQVPDEIVPQAQIFFTSVLGVDVNNDEDLQALYSGVDAYFARPDKEGIPRPAVERAVNIMKYWPMTNPQNASAWYVPWPLDVIFQIDSNPSTMGYFSKLINKQLPIAMTNESGDSNIEGQGGAIASAVKSPKFWLFAVIAIAVIAGIVYLSKRKK